MKGKRKDNYMESLFWKAVCALAGWCHLSWGHVTLWLRSLQTLMLIWATDWEQREVELVWRMKVRKIITKWNMSDLSLALGLNVHEQPADVAADGVNLVFQIFEWPLSFLQTLDIACLLELLSSVPFPKSIQSVSDCSTFWQTFLPWLLFFFS